MQATSKFRYSQKAKVGYSHLGDGPDEKKKLKTYLLKHMFVIFH